jgi:hypothetical protein
VKYDNPFVRLRDRLGISQTDFARAVEVRYGTWRDYERCRSDVPDEVMQRIKTFAVQHGCGDIATELSGEEWRVHPLIHPPEEFAAPLQAPPVSAEPERQQWHAYLDAILDSGNQKAIGAVQSNLIVFHDYIAASAPKLVPRGVPKIVRRRDAK